MKFGSGYMSPASDSMFLPFSTAMHLADPSTCATWRQTVKVGPSPRPKACAQAESSVSFLRPPNPPGLRRMFDLQPGDPITEPEKTDNKQWHGSRAASREEQKRRVRTGKICAHCSDRDNRIRQHQHGRG